MSCGCNKSKTSCGCGQSSNSCSCGKPDCGQHEQPENMGSVIKQLIDDCSKLPMNPMTIAMAVYTNQGYTVQQALDKINDRIAMIFRGEGIDLNSLRAELMQYCNDLIAEVGIDDATVRTLVMQFLDRYDWMSLFDKPKWVAKLMELTNKKQVIELEAEEYIIPETVGDQTVSMLPANMQHKAIHFIEEGTNLTNLKDGWYMYRQMSYLWNVTKKDSGYTEKTDVADINALQDIILGLEVPEVVKERALKISERVFGNRVVDIACVNGAINEILGQQNLVYPENPLIYIMTNEDGERKVFKGMSLRPFNTYTDIDNDLLFYWDGRRCNYLNSTKYANVNCLGTRSQTGNTVWKITCDSTWTKVKTWLDFGCEVVYKIRLIRDDDVKVINAFVQVADGDKFEACGSTFDEVVKLTHEKTAGKDVINISATSLAKTEEKTILDTAMTKRDLTHVEQMTAKHLYANDDAAAVAYDGTTVSKSTPTVGQVAINAINNYGVSVGVDTITINPKQDDGTTTVLSKNNVKDIISDTLKGETDRIRNVDDQIKLF